MDDRIIELLYRNLEEVFGEGDAARRRAVIRDLYTEDCVLYVPPGVLLGTPHWTSSLETSAQHIHILSIRPMASLKRCITGEFWHGAQGQKAKSKTTLDWMSSLFATARSLRSTSFSIPKLRSGDKAPMSPLARALNEQLPVAFGAATIAVTHFVFGEERHG
jgi:hypothetical protein